MFTSLRTLRWNALWKGRRGRPSRPARRAPRLTLEGLEPRTVPSASPLVSPLGIVSPAASPDGGTSTNSGFIPSQIAQAYGASTLLGNYITGTDGQDETIGIVDAYNDPTIVGDVATFNSACGLPAFRLRVGRR